MCLASTIYKWIRVYYQFPSICRIILSGPLESFENILKAVAKSQILTLAFNIKPKNSVPIE